MFLTSHINKADGINWKGLTVGNVGRKCNGRIISRLSYLYHLTLLLDNWIQFINHSFKKNSGKFEIKSQITLQVVQSYSQAVPSVLRFIRDFLF